MAPMSHITEPPEFEVRRTESGAELVISVTRLDFVSDVLAGRPVHWIESSTREMVISMNRHQVTHLRDRINDALDAYW